MTETLWVVIDSISYGYYVEFLGFITLLALLLGSTVIIVKNPMSSLLFLIGLFGVMSIYFILIGLEYIGFAYLVVYIGAISILFLFVLMLIDIRTSELTSNNKNSIPLGLFIIIILNSSWYQLGLSNDLLKTFSFQDSYDKLLNLLGWIGSEKSSSAGKQEEMFLMFTTSTNWESYMVETSHINAIGMVLYTTYNMWLFITGLILLLAMIGAIRITIQEKNKGS